MLAAIKPRLPTWPCDPASGCAAKELWAGPWPRQQHIDGEQINKTCKCNIKYYSDFAGKENLNCTVVQAHSEDIMLRDIS